MSAWPASVLGGIALAPAKRRSSRGDGSMHGRRLATAILFGALAIGINAADAQPYPSKPIRIIVPFAAGGAVDALARIISARLQESIGQPVIVENRAGAGGMTGADLVAKAPP